MLFILFIFILYYVYDVIINIKSTQRRRKHCALAVVTRSQKISPRRGLGMAKFNQLEMVTTFTYKPSLTRIDARNFKLSW